LTTHIEWQDQHGNWHHHQTKQNQADAYRVAQRRTESTGMRPRLVDGDGRLLDLLQFTLKADCIYQVNLS
jgi:hypothetical protein